MAPPPPPSSLSLLLSFLLLAVAAAGGGQSQPLQYQKFNPIPLRSISSAVADEFLTWTVDPETLAAESAADLTASSLEFRLAHRDALSVATPEQLLHLRLDRDAARLFQIATAAAGGRPRSFSSSVVSGLAQGSGEYFTRIGVGTPPSYAYMIIDTGSDVVWLQCAPCRRCYNQSDPIFDPRHSRSYAAVPCGAPLCRRLDVSGCDSLRSSCLYHVSYGDGSVTSGDFSTETLTFHGGGRVTRVALGCGHDNEGLFIAASGLLGLGRGALSFPSQAGRRLGRRFSYCLFDRTSSSSSSTSNRTTSSVVFGAAAVPRNAAVAFTPMLRNPNMDTFYYLELTGISVGGVPVAAASAASLRLDPVTGKGGVIVDSGTSTTRLVRAAYEGMRDAFKDALKGSVAGLKELPGGFSLFDTCYDLEGKAEVKVPKVVMHLGGGAQVSLPAENCLIPVDSKGTFCFAFAGTDGGVSIIGNIQQQGFRVIFDGAGGRVGFAPHSC